MYQMLTLVPFFSTPYLVLKVKNQSAPEKGACCIIKYLKPRVSKGTEENHTYWSFFKHHGYERRGTT